MALGCCKVDETAFAENYYSIARVLELVLFHERPQVVSAGAHVRKGDEVELDVEMARVGHYCAVMHCGEMGAVNHMTVSGDCDEYIADWGGLFYRHNSETIHDCLNGPNWIYFADDDIS